MHINSSLIIHEFFSEFIIFFTHCSTCLRHSDLSANGNYAFLDSYTENLLIFNPFSFSCFSFPFFIFLFFLLLRSTCDIIMPVIKNFMYFETLKKRNNLAVLTVFQKPLPLLILQPWISSFIKFLLKCYKIVLPRVVYITPTRFYNLLYCSTVYFWYN